VNAPLRGDSGVSPRSLHRLGLACGLAAGAWLGGAEAPAKLAAVGFSPLLISLGMVAGVFVARWTVPMALKGTTFVWRDLRDNVHLIVWAVLAGMLWAVANALTVFAIRDVGLSIAFPLWNTNSLVGLAWGFLLFNELRGSKPREWVKVLGGALAIAGGACLLALASQRTAGSAPRAATLGVLAALGAGVLWGTMYIPYRKAYLSGMNPLSFVTVFTFGELGTTLALAAKSYGGFGQLMAQVAIARPALFWLFLGGFCWVLGDLFQQYATKYIGISRGIPLSNTNQLWGLAWGALVFGELSGLGWKAQALVIAGSLTMIAGAAAIGFAEAKGEEAVSWKRAVQRECRRYGLDEVHVASALAGNDSFAGAKPQRHWWEVLIVLAGVVVFVYLALGARPQPIAVHAGWMVVLAVASLVMLAACGALLWRRTRFS
jgi:drug/metabolite transporter (DMT)-like permease